MIYNCRYVVGKLLDHYYERLQQAACKEELAFLMARYLYYTNYYSLL